jgi:protein-S-isoprenylcysteine O-methyltransferase Ste14
METAWYFRLFVPNIAWFLISWLLFFLIGAKRMTGPGPRRSFQMGFWVMLFAGWSLTWFIKFSIGPAFWIGIALIVLGEVLFALGYIAMREHPEKTRAVVDWGIYGFNRHSHVLASVVCLLGVVVMGWQQSVLYGILWVYFFLYVAMMHVGVLNEEKLNIERFGQEYANYMKRVPRYFPVRSKTGGS